MSNESKRSVLPQGVRRVAPPSKSLDDKSDGKGDDGKQLVPSSSSSTPSARDLSQLLARQLLDDDAPQFKHFYAAQVGAAGGAVTVTNSYTGTLKSLSAVAAGTTPITRIADQIRIKQLSIRLAFWTDGSTVNDLTTSGVTGFDVVQPSVRFVIFRDNFPPIGTPTWCDPGIAQPSPPTSVNALMCMPTVGSTPANDMTIVLAPKNFVTDKRYHIFVDETVAIPFKMTEGQSTTSGTSGTLWRSKQGVCFRDFHIPMDFVSQWYDSTNASAIMTNQLYIIAVSTLYTTSTPQYTTNMSWWSDMKFLDA